MAITWFNVKKWTKMLLGRSVSHVPQNIGLYFSKNEIRGYYNDLRGKITKDRVAIGGLPKNEVTGKQTEFPTQIFQYGLGTFDMYLETSDTKYLASFWAAVEWAENHQENDGGWIAFPKYANPYSSMSQGEGISLLARAQVLRPNAKRDEKIDKACNFLIQKTSILDSETGLLLFEEYPGKPIVFNGMVFSAFGLYDLWLLRKTPEAKKLWDDAEKEIAGILPKFDSGGWSFYSLGGNFASKFYLNVHVAQCKALFELTGEHVFEYYASRWEKYLKNPVRRSIYFWKKALQKIKEKETKAF